jgi:hypothetical protein
MQLVGAAAKRSMIRTPRRAAAGRGMVAGDAGLRWSSLPASAGQGCDACNLAACQNTLFRLLELHDGKSFGLPL